MRFLLRYFLTAFLLLPFAVHAGEEKVASKINEGELKEGWELVRMRKDSTLHKNLREIYVFPKPKFENRRQQRRYSKMVYTIKKVLPYAKMTNQKLIEIDNKLSQVKSEKERKEMLKEEEKILFKEFSKPLKKLSFRQGQLLIKLIDRETGNTSFNLIQDYKGRFSAAFWQTFARIFGSNLKEEYDPDGEDRLIEQIVIMVENNQI